MPPRTPQPGHPLADAAQLEADQIAALANAQVVAPPAPNAPVPPLPASALHDDPPAPNADTSPADRQDDDLPPLDPKYAKMLVDQHDTLLGRLDAENRARREAEEVAKAALANKEFMEKRNQELVEDKRKAEAELSKFLAERDVTQAVAGFEGEHVDREAFGEIYRGFHPHLQRIETSIQTRIDQAVDKRVKEVKAESEHREGELRKELNEKAIMRDVPAFGRLVERPDFKDFLAETVPGTRTTRRAEVLSAWRDGDTRFIADVVEQFKLRGNPKAVDNEPVNHGRPPADQSPRTPTPEPVVDEDTLAVAMQQLKEGAIPPAQYRKLKALYDKQQLEAWRRSKRQ